VAIKWSAVKVSEAMDEVEAQIALADQFLAEAKAKAREARSIPNLPSYMDDRFVSLITQLERIDNVKGAIESARNAIPDGAIEAEWESLKYGNQQSLI